PGAVRSLPALFETDPSYAYLAAAPELSTAVDAHLKAFRTLAPERVGVECVAELIASLRSTILEGYATLPFYQLDFLDAPLQLQAAPPVPERFSVELDFSAARALVEIVGVPGASAEQVDRTIDTDLFRAL